MRCPLFRFPAGRSAREQPPPPVRRPRVRARSSLLPEAALRGASFLLCPAAELCPGCTLPALAPAPPVRARSGRYGV